MTNNSSPLTLNLASIPKHVGIILDGNRRWAKDLGLPTKEGHAEGARTIEPIIRAAFSEGVEYVSLFVFSTENWKRTEEEVGYLMRLFIHYFKKESKKLVRDGFKVLFSGRRKDLERGDIKNAIKELEESSKNGKNGTVIFSFNYGGHSEIADAAKKIVESGCKAEDVNEQMLADSMYQPDVPEIDLIIRTSGEMRLSGFQLWRAAYAELMFVDKHWPDFKKEDIIKAVKEYGNRQRRFGS